MEIIATKFFIVLILLLVGFALIFFATMHPPKWLQWLLGYAYVIYLILQEWFYIVLINLKAFLGWVCIPMILYTTKILYALKQAKNKRMELQARKRYFGRY